MVGPTGCGKTHLSCSIAIRLFDRGITIHRTGMLELLARLRASFNRDGEIEHDIFCDCTDPALLVLDDLGAEAREDKASAWSLQIVYRILEQRFEQNKALIYTSNFNTSEMFSGPMGDRIVSRLVGMVESIGEFPASDFRRQRA
jgi:DNA replication protein DnaC